MRLAKGCVASSPASTYAAPPLPKESRMSTAHPPVTEATLAAFSDAWNRHDVDALMSFMSEDCVFETAAGPDACGTRHSGVAAVRKAFAAAWETVTDAQWRDGVHHVIGDFGVSEWTFTGTAADGSRIEVNGVDLFTFKNGKIQLKNSLRKARPNLPAASTKRT
jgi:ketosteroid isomerase-like protein